VGDAQQIDINLVGVEKHAASVGPGAGLITVFVEQTIKRFAQTLIDRDWKKGTSSTFRTIESGACA
jgi:hypothetical protein